LKYSAAASSAELDAISTFASIDVDATRGIISQLAYIKDREGKKAQKYIDEQIELWSAKTWFSIWTIYLPRGSQKAGGCLHKFRGDGCG